MTTRNTRVHPDAVIPIGSMTLEADTGAATLAVPNGASGILMQNLATNGSYWSFEAMTDVDQGFKFGTDLEKVWFNTQTENIYLFVHASDTIVYQFVAPVAY